MKLVGDTGKGGIRLYTKKADRKRALAMLAKAGFNYFVGFQDEAAQAKFGLSYGWANWAGLFPFIQGM